MHIFRRLRTHPLIRKWISNWQQVALLPFLPSSSNKWFLDDSNNNKTEDWEIGKAEDGEEKVAELRQPSLLKLIWRQAISHIAEMENSAKLQPCWKLISILAHSHLQKIITFHPTNCAPNRMSCSATTKNFLFHDPAKPSNCTTRTLQTPSPPHSSFF